MAVFYPSLSELVHLGDSDDSFNCVWSTKDKGSGEWRMCRCRILLEERRKRDGLVWDIQAIMNNRSKATPASRRTRHAEDAILLSKLDLLSNLVLCKKAHRSSKAKDLTATWTESLRHLETEVDRDEINPIRRRLGLSLGDSLTCCEQSHSIACRNGIEASKRERAREILKDLTRTQATSVSTCSTMKELASLLLCSGHLDKVGSKSKEWTDAFSVSRDKPKQHTPIVSEDVAATSQPSPKVSRKPLVITKTTRSSDTAAVASPEISQARTQGDEDTPCVSHPRVTRRTTRELASGFLAPEPAPILFEPYRPLANKEIAKKITTLIKRDLLPLSECESGYVYAFRRDSSNRIKIGCSDDVKRRMNELKKECKQNITVLAKEYMPHFRKAEKIIHLILNQERLRENLINGRCNGGKGCPKKHGEWFTAILQQVKDILKLVKSFMECKPYGEDRQLKKSWKLRVNETEIMPLFDPEQDTLHNFVLKEKSITEAKLKGIVDNSSSDSDSAPSIMSKASASKPESRVQKEDDKVVWTNSCSSASIVQGRSHMIPSMPMGNQAIEVLC